MKKILGILLSLMIVISIVGCTQEDIKKTTDETTGEQSVVDINIAALKGPTAMGMVKLMDDSKSSEDSGYTFSLHTAVDEITPKLISGDIDIAAVPSNMASVLYNNTKGNIQVLAVNTLGVLYIAENGQTVNTLDDLAGKTIYASGKGATPEYVLNYILTENDLMDKVTIEWKSEHAECVTALVTNPDGVAMIPEPFVTTAKSKQKEIRTAIDLTKEWNDLGGDSQSITGVLVGNKEFIDENKDAVNEFLTKYEESIAYTESNLEDSAKLIGEFDIVPEPVAILALPKCNIDYIDGEEMKTTLEGYLQVLYDANPKSVGGAMPADDFYYVK